MRAYFIRNLWIVLLHRKGQVPIYANDDGRYCAIVRTIDDSFHSR